MTLENFSGFTICWIIYYLYIWILNFCDIDDHTGWLTIFEWNIGNLTYLYIYDKFLLGANPLFYLLVIIACIMVQIQHVDAR